MGFFDARYTKVDRQLMENGAKVDFGGGFFVTVRHTSSSAVSLARQKITKQLKILGRNKEFTDDQNDEITSYVAAHAGIVTWEGGGVDAFTPEYALKVFKDTPEFRNDVVTAMQSYEAFREGETKDAVGN